MALTGSSARIRFRSPRLVVSVDEEVRWRCGVRGPNGDAATVRILTVCIAFFQSNLPFDGPGVLGVPGSLAAVAKVGLSAAGESSGEGKEVSGTPAK
jgi:hypothetical protein